MIGRHNLFIIHPWDEAHRYARMTDLVRARQSGLADYSVPPWKALTGDADDVADGITSRMKTASAVVVMNSPGLHRRPWSKFEMELAVEMGKRIIVLQPHDEFDCPIPAVLDGSLYRVAPWRSDVLGRAIRGEYPQDNRVFDIAEVAERRALVVTLAAASGFVSFLVSGVTALALTALQREMRQHGLALRWTQEDTTNVVVPALGGAAVAGLVAALVTGDAKSTLVAAAAGAGVGATIGLVRVYAAKLHGTAAIRTLTLEPT